MSFMKIKIDGFSMIFKDDSIEVKRKYAIDPKNTPKVIKEFYRLIESEIDRCNVYQLFRGSSHYFLNNFKIFINKDLVLLKRCSNLYQEGNFILNDKEISNLKTLLYRGIYL